MKRVAAVLFLVAATAGVAGAQSIPAPGSLANTEQPKHCYAMNYVLKELDGTKLVNQRAYVLNTFAAPSNWASGEWTRLRVGNRVPIGTGKDVNYVDVGVNIDNRLREAGDALALEVTAEISSIASAKEGVIEPPTVRQVKGTAASLISPGKPAVVFSADDPTSQHRFELQVTATLVK